MAADATLTDPTTERLQALEDKLDAVTAMLRRQERQRAAWEDLAHDAGEVAGPVVATLTQRLAELDEQGHLEFARAGVEVADRVMTSFDADDVRALGDNIVVILDTVRQMTQPEVMALVRRTATAAGEPLPDASGPPPSVLRLLRDLGDPDVRRGLGRLMALLRSMGDGDPHSPQ